MTSENRSYGRHNQRADLPWCQIATRQRVNSQKCLEAGPTADTTSHRLSVPCTLTVLSVHMSHQLSIALSSAQNRRRPVRLHACAPLQLSIKQPSVCTGLLWAHCCQSGHLQDWLSASSALEGPSSCSTHANSGWSATNLKCSTVLSLPR